MLKRAGRGHDIDRGIDETYPGELAVSCPACPNPKVNLPEGWEAAQDSMKFLYALFLAIDACFRLKRRLISNDAKDPGLVDGKGYFVEDAPFKTYIKKVGDQVEMSTCSGLAALDYANTKYSKGYASTGKGLVVCACHEFVQANGVVDLQKGERYANMDYCLASASHHHHRKLRRTLSYNIMCQFYKHLHERLRKLPKMGIERAWANMGPVATSTREMGPGGHHDTLEDHFGSWNWGKLVGLGRLLRRRLADALADAQEHWEELEDFTRGQEEHIEEWKQMIKDWDQWVESRGTPPPRDPDEYAAWTTLRTQPTMPNPYEVPKSGLNEHDIRLQLAEEDHQWSKRGDVPRHDMSPSEFVLCALDLEETHAKEQTALVTRRTHVLRDIENLCLVQAVYTPGALQVVKERAQEPVIDVQSGQPKLEPAESIPLFLPSTLPAAHQRTCTEGIIEVEKRLRHAQCQSALDSLRAHLFVRARLKQYKHLHVRHQGVTTRAQGIMARNEKQIQLDAAKYNAARAALVGLTDGNEVDIRCIEDDEAKGKRKANNEDSANNVAGASEVVQGKRSSEGNASGEDEDMEETVDGGKRPKSHLQQVSWIWKTMGEVGSEQIDMPEVASSMSAAVRAEWCKAYARRERFSEEVLLLKEEMRRVLKSLEHSEKLWLARAAAFSGDDGLCEGRHAYAYEQAAQYTRIAEAYRQLWLVKPATMTVQLEPVHEDSEENEDDTEEEGMEGEDADS
ncbi:hypothetical protein FISHEDRAFT_58576 [Fistulina hepatica ATCC 64428]|uniref:CxC2-like cysteine cluster KDZ transposase-associated domain-containing protein n=1 Tax=Fistulina hepatica ATCC 64428 TaxID=1128425 RepID=A0A0D7AE74_9AGAR|nr:hypothetical protein FISHEDRAFT_58576 [Fistulina hepatica ATCC 64428]